MAAYHGTAEVTRTLSGASQLQRKREHERARECILERLTDSG